MTNDPNGATGEAMPARQSTAPMSNHDAVDAIHAIQNMATAMRLMSDTLGEGLNGPFSQIAFEMEEKLGALADALSKKRETDQ